MKKTMYLHGFGSSGASGTVELLRREFWDKASPGRRAEKAGRSRDAGRRVRSGRR